MDSAQIATSTTPTQIAAPGTALTGGSGSSNPSGVEHTEVVVNNNGTVVVAIGGPNVTNANGLRIPVNGSARITLGPGEVLWAVSASAGVIDVLQSL